MRERGMNPISILLASLLFSSAADAGLVVESILHACDVSRNVPPYEQDAEYFDLPNPVPYDYLTHTASIAPSFCAGSYASSWSADNGEFQLGITHRLEDVEGDVGANGSYRIRPSIDSILTINGSFAYSHPPGELGSAGFIFRVRIDGGPVVFSTGGGGGTVGLGSPTGTIPVSGSTLLHAGELYRISYVVSTDNFDPPPLNAVWAGDGGFTFSIAPVPEPTSMVPFGLCLLITARRRARFIR